MAHAFSEIMFTSQVRAAQSRFSSRGANERFEAPGFPPRDRLGPEEAAFIEARDSFYVATVSETGWPYVQHRGGPPGFLKAIDERTLAFPNFRGDRQYVTLGNLHGDARAALILMDYPNRRRLKVLGRIQPVDTGAGAIEVELPSNPARIERAFVMEVLAFDWNCPQYITPRFTIAEVEARIGPLRARLAELERAASELQGTPRPQSWPSSPGERP